MSSLRPLTFAACLSSLALSLALRAQTQAPPPPPKFKAGDITSAEQLQQEIRAAKRPKSDKWTLSLLPVGLQKNPQVDYTIVTELTDAGRALPEPSFDKPVYCISHSMGQQDVGDAYGGTHDIEYKFLQKQFNAALVSNGYRPAGPELPEPTQVLFFVWGMHNRMETADTMDDGGDDSGAGDVSANSDDIMNMLSRAKIVGGQKFADEFARALADQLEWSGTPDYSQNGPLRRFAERDDTTESLVYEIFDDCYYLLVYALDLEALRNNQKKLLWTTHISTTARGISFEATLPIMINNGAYFFGRETNGPEILRKRAYKNASVQIGDATVVEYVSGSTSPPPDATGGAKPATSGTAAAAVSGTTGP